MLAQAMRVTGGLMGLLCALPLLAAPAKGEWKENLKDVPFPEGEAAGSIKGQEVVVDNAEINTRAGVLTLRQGKSGATAFQMVVFLFLKKDQKPDGMLFTLEKGGEAATPHVHLRWKNGAAAMNGLDGYRIRLQFGERMGDQLPGQIYYCAPDVEKSYLAGSFSATVR